MSFPATMSVPAATSFPATTHAHRIKLILFGILLPLATLAVELMTGMSARAFADPVPDPARLLLVLAVPGTAGFLLARSRREAPFGAAVSTLAGVAIGIAAWYALLYLPMMPFAIPGLLLGIGVLPLAPVASLVAIWLFIGPARRRGDMQRRWMGAGFAFAILLLLALDAPATLARLAIDRQRQGD